MTLDLSRLIGAGPAKLALLPTYLRRAVRRVTPGAEVVITGQAPVWLYLCVAHALHGRVRVLYYESPVSGRVEVFNHDPG